MYLSKQNPQARLQRALKRLAKQANYHSNGLNGERAIARRRRQIAGWMDGPRDLVRVQ